MKTLLTLLEIAYVPPDQTKKLRCEYCEHFWSKQRRCGIIRESEGAISANGCCKRWRNFDVLNSLYPNSKIVPRTHMMTVQPPDVGVLMTKAEALYVESVDKIDGCRDCIRFVGPEGETVTDRKPLKLKDDVKATCSVVGTDSIQAGGACAGEWRNPWKEKADPGLHAEFKEGPPELKTKKA